MPYVIYENNDLIGVCKTEDIDDVRAKLERSNEAKLMRQRLRNQTLHEINQVIAQRNLIRDRQATLGNLKIDMKAVEQKDRQSMVENLKAFRKEEAAKLQEDWRKLGDQLAKLNREKLDRENDVSHYRFVKTKILK